MLNKLKHLVVFLFFLSETIICQRDILNFPEQKYIYNDSSITLSISGPLYSTTSDSVQFEITLLNNSDEKIFVFNQIKPIYNISSSILILDYGGGFEAELDHEVVLQRIDSRKEVKLSHKVLIKDLLDIGFNRYAHLSISLGILKDFKKIGSQKLGSEIRTKLKDDTLEISSIILDSILWRIELDLFSVQIL